MAEMMLANSTNLEDEASVPLLDDHRPPKLTQEEAIYLLERGPYIGRLRAKERLLEIVLAFSIDEQTMEDMNPRQSELIKEDIARLETELTHFNESFDVKDSVELSPTRVIIPVDFLKRREAAVCSETDPEMFFPEKGGSTREAKRVCEKSCDLTDECLAYALEEKERFGIWGGKSERERRKLLKNRVSS